MFLLFASEMLSILVDKLIGYADDSTLMIGVSVTTTLDALELQ